MCLLLFPQVLTTYHGNGFCHFFGGRTSKKERSLPNLCMWDLAVRLAKSLPTYRKGNGTHRLLPNRLLGKNPLEQLFEKSASMPQTGGPLAMNSWQWFNTRTSAVAGKKQHVTQRLIIGLTFLYRLRMVQTAMIVIRHVKGFAVHCYSYPVTRQSVCRNIHKFHQIPALNQNGKQRVGNFNACISERILRQDFWQHSQPSSHGLGHEICVSCPKNSQKFSNQCLV